MRLLFLSSMLAGVLLAHRASAAEPPNADLLALHLETNDLPAGYIADWTDMSMLGNNATQEESSKKPYVYGNYRFCHSAARFSDDDVLEIAPATNLNPDNGSLNIFVVAAFTSTTKPASGKRPIVSRGVDESGTECASDYWELAHAYGDSKLASQVRSCQPGVPDYGGSVTTRFAETYRTAVLHMQMDAGSCAAANASGVMTSCNTVQEYVDLYTTGNSNGEVTHTSGNTYYGDVNAEGAVRIGGGFAGILYAVLAYSSPQSSDIDRTAITNYLSDRYYIGCQQMTTAGGSTSTTNDQRDRGSFYQYCYSGRNVISGSQNHFCLDGEWREGPTVCGYTCPTVKPPADLGSCGRTVVAEGFNADDVWGADDLTFAAAATDTQRPGGAVPWWMEPSVPRAYRDDYWRRDATNQRLQTTMTTALAACSDVDVSAYAIQDPWWQSLPSSVLRRIDATVHVDAGRLGVSLIYNSPTSNYALYLDPAASSATARVRLQRGSLLVAYPPTEVRDWVMENVNPNNTFHIRIEWQESNFKVWLNTTTWQGAGDRDPADGSVYPDPLVPSAETLGPPLIEYYDFNKWTGAAALLSDEGDGWFDDIVITTGCDEGEQCSDPVEGTRCSFACRAGFSIASGNGTRQCMDTEEVTGEAPVCLIDPPMPPSNVSAMTVHELAEGGTEIGEAIAFSSDAEGAAIIYKLVGGGPMVDGQPVFQIGLCSGQVSLRRSGLLDHETAPTMTLTVEAIPNGVQVSAATMEVTVTVLDDDEAPVLPANLPGRAYAAMRNVSEAAPADSPIGEPFVAIDPEGRPSETVYSLLAANPPEVLADPLLDDEPLVVVNSTTGQLSVGPRAGLNYEVLPSFTVTVKAASSLNEDLFTTAIVLINVQDANDAPQFATGDIVRTSSDPTATVALPPPITASDADGDSLTYSVSSVTLLAKLDRLVIPNKDILFTIDESSGLLAWNSSLSVEVLSTDELPVMSGYAAVAAFEVGLVASDGELSGDGLAQVIWTPSNDTVTLIPRLTGGSGLTGHSTRGGDSATFLGADLAPDEGTSIVAELTWPVSGKVEQLVSTACSTASTAEMTCTVPAGVGTGIKWAFNMTIDGAMRQVVVPAGLVTSYAPPVIQQLSGNTNWLTRGGSSAQYLVTNAGTSLDEIKIRQGGETPGEYTQELNVYYMRSFVQGSDQVSQIYFQQGEGCGEMAHLQLNIGGFILEPTAKAFNGQFGPPKITALRRGYEYVYAYTIPPRTVQGISTPMFYPVAPEIRYSSFWYNYIDHLVVEGENFCAAKDRISTSVTIGTEGVTPVYNLINCVTYSGYEHTRLDCGSMVEGQGTDLYATVTINGQTSQSSKDTASWYYSYVRYYSPSSRSFSGPFYADTAGGSTALITVRYAGPVGYSDIKAQFGPEWPYDQISTTCTVIEYRKNSYEGTVSCTIPQLPTNVRQTENHYWRITVANQPTNNLVGTTSYGPAIISEISGEGAFQASTAGGDVVRITGKNFAGQLYGPSDELPSRIWYTQAIEDTGNNQSVVIGDGSGMLTYSPESCTMVTPHTELQCVTAPGGGGDLRWHLNINGRDSRTPFSTYERAMVSNITYVDGSMPVVDADPLGGTQVILNGTGFGPPSSEPYVKGSMTGPLVQWVRYGRPGMPPSAMRDARNFTVLSHNKVLVTLGPGLGSDLVVRLSVADQVSAESVGTFSFVSPQIVAVVPEVGPTAVDADAPSLVRLVVRQLPSLASMDAEAAIRWGNVADGSLREGPEFPLLQAEQLSRSALPGEWSQDPTVSGLQFVQPPGAGQLRRIQLLIGDLGADLTIPYQQQAEDWYVTEETGEFNYTDPEFYFFEVATPDGDNTPQEDILAIISKFGFPFTGVRQISVYGDYFSDAIASDGFEDNLLRQIMVRDDDAANPEFYAHTSAQMDSFVLMGTRGWNDTGVRFYTNLERLSVKLRIESTSPAVDPVNPGEQSGDTIVLVQETAAFSLDKATPIVEALKGEPEGGFLTAGGQLLGVTVLGGLVTDPGPLDTLVGYNDSALELEQGSCYVANIDPYEDANTVIDTSDTSKTGVPATAWTEATLLPPGWTGSPPLVLQSGEDANAFIRKRCELYWNSQGGGSSFNQDSQCEFYCSMPPGDGKQSPVQLRKGEAFSSVAFIGFAAPTAAEVRVLDYTVSPPTTTDWVPPGTEHTLPPSGAGYVAIKGANFGRCPTVRFGLSYRRTLCPPSSLSGPEMTSDDSLVVAVPPGEGAAGLTFVVEAGSGSLLNMQGTVEMDFKYTAPSVTDVRVEGTPNTEGGSSLSNGPVVVVEGLYFGAFNPDVIPVQQVTRVEIGLPGDPSVPFYDCSTGAFSRSQTELRCPLPAGAGKDLAVRVTVAGQTTLCDTSACRISYSPPTVDTVSVLVLNGTGYPVKPAPSSGNVSAVAEAAPSRRVLLQSADASEVVTVPTTGAVLVLKGNNFGPRYASTGTSCAFASFKWADGLLPSGQPANPVCDGEESFHGEGEVYDDMAVGSGAPSLAAVAAALEKVNGDEEASGRLLQWSHTEVALSIPAGLGNLVVRVAARNQLQPDALEVDYEAPVVSGVSATTTLLGEPNIGVDFDSCVTVEGSGFGPTPAATSAYSTMGLTTPQSLPLSPLLRPPLASLAIDMSGYCLTDAVEYDFTKPAPIPAPTRWYPLPSMQQVVDGTPQGCMLAIQEHSDDSVVLRVPPGVGTGRPLRVRVVQRDATLGQSPAAASAPATFAYSAPSNLQAVSTELYLATWESFATDPISLRVVGNNLGRAIHEPPVDSPKAGPGGWYAADGSPDMGITVNGLECMVPPTRTRYNKSATFSPESPTPFPGVGSDGYYGCGTGDFASQQLPESVQCAQIPNITVGVLDVAVTVAGQTSVLNTYTPVMAGCYRGYYGQPGEVCLACPDGGICDGMVNREHLAPVSIEGFYSLDTPAKLERCTTGNEEEVARGVCIVPCLPARACLGNNVCANGYADEGPMFRCASCAEGFYRRNGACEVCPKSPALIAAAFVLVILLGGAGAWVLNQKDISVAMLAIGVDFFQVLALFATTDVEWPPVIAQMFHIFSAFNLNIEITTPECLVPSVTFRQKWWAFMALPLGVACLLILVFLGYAGFKFFCRGQRTRRKMLSHSPKLISGFVILCYFLYISLTRTVLNVFDCEPTGSAADPNTYLAQAPTEQCWQAGGMQMQLLPWAIVFLVGYTVGYPLLVGFVVWKNRYAMMLDQLLRARGLGYDRSADHKSYEVRKKYNRLYFQLRPDYVHWAIFILGRKFLIAFASIMFSQSSTFTMAFVLLVCFVAYSLQVRYVPYMSPGERDEVIRSHQLQAEGTVDEDGVKHLTVHSSLAADLLEAERRIRKKGRRADWHVRHKRTNNNDGAQAVVASAASWLLSYNTVESILLFSMVLISVAGIMFDSDLIKDPAYKHQQNTLVALVMFVMLGSTIYFFLAFICETYILWQEAAVRTGAKDVDDVLTIWEIVTCRCFGTRTAGGRRRGGVMVAARKQSRRNMLNPVAGASGSRRNLAIGDDDEVMEEAETATGGTNLNPLVMGSAGIPSLVGESATELGPQEDDIKQFSEALLALDQPPAADTWASVRTMFGATVRQLEEYRHLVAELRRDQASSGAGNSLRVNNAAARRVRRKSTRQTFQPQVRGDDNDDGSGSPRRGPARVEMTGGTMVNPMRTRRTRLGRTASGRRGPGRSASSGGGSGAARGSGMSGGRGSASGGSGAGIVENAAAPPPPPPPRGAQSAGAATPRQDEEAKVGEST